jgi:hypothetical protein
MALCPLRITFQLWSFKWAPRVTQRYTGTHAGARQTPDNSKRKNTREDLAISETRPGRRGKKESKKKQTEFSSSGSLLLLQARKPKPTLCRRRFFPNNKRRCACNLDRNKKQQQTLQGQTLPRRPIIRAAWGSFFQGFRLRLKICTQKKNQFPPPSSPFTAREKVAIQTTQTEESPSLFSTRTDSNADMFFD